MRFAARNLIKEGKVRDGKTGFKILLEQYPKSWRAWRDYGIGLLKTGDKAGALRYFKIGLELNPGYDFFRDQIKKLEGSSK